MTLETVRQKLMDEIAKYDATEAAMLGWALALAERTHEGQYRRQTVERPDNHDPYIIHPMRVALVLLEEIGLRSPAVIAGALLHDVIEDSDGRVTEEDIARDFGVEVATTVALLSKPPESTDIPRHQQLATYHANIAAAALPVRLVKLADRLDNIRELLLTRDRPRQVKYLNETREIYLPLAAATNPFFYSAISDMCDRLEQLL